MVRHSRTMKDVPATAIATTEDVSTTPTSLGRAVDLDVQRYQRLREKGLIVAPKGQQHQRHSRQQHTKTTTTTTMTKTSTPTKSKMMTTTTSKNISSNDNNKTRTDSTLKSKQQQMIMKMTKKKKPKNKKKKKKKKKKTFPGPPSLAGTARLIDEMDPLNFDDDEDSTDDDDDDDDDNGMQQFYYEEDELDALVDNNNDNNNNKAMASSFDKYNRGAPPQYQHHVYHNYYFEDNNSNNGNNHYENGDNNHDHRRHPTNTRRGRGRGDNTNDDARRDPPLGRGEDDHRHTNGYYSEQQLLLSTVDEDEDDGSANDGTVESSLTGSVMIDHPFHANGPVGTTRGRGESRKVTNGRLRRTSGGGYGDHYASLDDSQVGDVGGHPKSRKGGQQRQQQHQQRIPSDVVHRSNENQQEHRDPPPSSIEEEEKGGIVDPEPQDIDILRKIPRSNIPDPNQSQQQQQQHWPNPFAFNCAIPGGAATTTASVTPFEQQPKSKEQDQSGSRKIRVLRPSKHAHYSTTGGENDSAVGSMTWTVASNQSVDNSKGSTPVKPVRGQGGARGGGMGDSKKGHHQQQQTKKTKTKSPSKFNSRRNLFVETGGNASTRMTNNDTGNYGESRQDTSATIAEPGHDDERNSSTTPTPRISGGGSGIKNRPSYGANEPSGDERIENDDGGIQSGGLFGAFSCAPAHASSSTNLPPKNPNTAANTTTSTNTKTQLGRNLWDEAQRRQHFQKMLQQARHGQVDLSNEKPFQQQQQQLGAAWKNKRMPFKPVSSMQVGTSSTVGDDAESDEGSWSFAQSKVPPTDLLAAYRPQMELQEQQNRQQQMEQKTGVASNGKSGKIDNSSVSLAISYVSQPGFLPPANSFHDPDDFLHTEDADDEDQESDEQQQLYNHYSNHDRKRTKEVKDQNASVLSLSPLDQVENEDVMWGLEDDSFETESIPGKMPVRSERLPDRPSLGIPSLASLNSSAESQGPRNRRSRESANKGKTPNGEKGNDEDKIILGARFRSATSLSPAIDPARPHSGVSSQHSESPTSRSLLPSTPSQELSSQYRRELPVDSLPTLDQRTVRLLYASEFSEMVQVHSSQHIKQILTEHSRGAKPPVTPSTLASSGLSFVVRKRPLLQSEVENGDFDVVDTPSEFTSAVVLYEASILPDRKTRDLKAHLFRVDQVFPPEVTSEEFYLRVGYPLVMAALDGGDSVLLSTGSEGSGKSYTISEIEERAAYDIFADEADSVFMEYLELRGDQCTDLLGPIGNLVSVVSVKGKYDFLGAVKESVSSVKEMLTKIESAKRRSLAQRMARQKMDIPSCLLCRITIADRTKIGTLYLLEAGLDDSNPRGAVMSPVVDVLSNIRCMLSTPSFLPSTNNHNLMKILRPVLESESSKLCVLGNISPASVDTEITLSTLLTLKTTMKGYDQAPKPSQGTISDESLVLPRQWTNDQLVSFLRRKHFLEREVATDMTGRLIMRMSKRQLQETFFRGKTASDRAEKLFMGLRAENDRIARLRVKKRLSDQRK